MKNGTFNGKPTVIISCSNCKCPLVEVIIVKEDDTKSEKIVAECCHCQDKSFKTTIKGKLIYASTDWCHATPEPVLKPRKFSDDPIEYTGEILVKTSKIKTWKR